MLHTYSMLVDSIIDLCFALSVLKFLTETFATKLSYI